MVIEIIMTCESQILKVDASCFTAFVLHYFALKRAAVKRVF